MQILQNLIGNAIKFMDKDQPLIKIASIEKSNYQQIYITDNGSGIPPEKFESIFNSFETAHHI